MATPPLARRSRLAEEGGSVLDMVERSCELAGRSSYGACGCGPEGSLWGGLSHWGRWRSGHHRRGRSLGPRPGAPFCLALAVRSRRGVCVWCSALRLGHSGKLLIPEAQRLLAAAAIFQGDPSLLFWGTPKLAGPYSGAFILVPRGPFWCEFR